MNVQECIAKSNSWSMLFEENDRAELERLNQLQLSKSACDKDIQRITASAEIGEAESLKLVTVLDLELAQLGKEERDIVEHRRLREVYFSQVEKKCNEAKLYFNKIAMTPDSKKMIIFDIDDTALLSVQSIKMLYPRLNCDDHQVILPVNHHVLNLYKYLLEKGFKIAFVSARVNYHDSCGLDVAILNLILAGYTDFDDIVCIDESFYTSDLSNRDKSQIRSCVAGWKHSMIRRYAGQFHYDVIGFLDDQCDNFAQCEWVFRKGCFDIPQVERIEWLLYHAPFRPF